MVSIEHKRGATFSWAGTVRLPAGTWTATSQVKMPDGSAIENLVVTLLQPVSPSLDHTISLYAWAVQTSLWPLGNAICDIRFTAGTEVIYCPTFEIQIVEVVTRA